jgi:hypothetical protein
MDIVKTGGSTATIKPTDDEVKTLCRVGEDADTCIFLTIGGDGWSCEGKSTMRGFLTQRAESGTSHAKRLGCDEVNNLDLLAL